jgi:hypothetical protein
MIDTTILGFIKEYLACRSFETELEICCKIAKYAGLTEPKNSDECNTVLAWVDKNHPDAYEKATAPARKFWSDVYPHINFN